MRAGPIVIFHVRQQQVTEVARAEHNNVVKAFPADRCACRKLNPAILVMQSAQDWATTNVPGAIDGARDRCIFLQG